MVGPTKILLIAAESDFRRDFASRLEQEGGAVAAAGTGADGLQRAGAEFDLIILDLELPDMDGLTVLRYLRGGNGIAPVATPVVLLKGEGEPSHVVQRGFDFGASGYVVKHRLPRKLASARILEALVKASTQDGARHDSCPFSARGAFSRCSVFLPLQINVADDGSEPLMSCSHLRIGTSDTWQLYPRCAIGDQVARDRYIEDRVPV